MDKKQQEISRAVVQRLPRYFRFVSQLRTKGVSRVSSRMLAESMALTASQIRQDFNCFGGFGQQGYGYNVEKLYEGLAQILGLQENRTCILIGVGNMGRALMKNFNFAESGFNLICAFDADKKVIGRELGTALVRDVADLFDYVDTHHPDVAVLTVPQFIAPDLSRELVEHGIRGIWNFTGTDLHLEGLGIPVENVHFSDNLMTLCYQVNQNQE